MKKRTKISLIVATALFLVGVLLFGIALAMADFDIRKLSNEKYELNTYDVDPSFDEIEIVSDISDITFTLSKDNTCRVLCHEREKLLHEVKVENGKLIIREVDTRKWYDYITFFSFGDASVTVSLPQAQYDALRIDVDTGDISIPEAVTFDRINVKTSTGDVIVHGGAQTERMEIVTSTGEIRIRNAWCEEIVLKTSTGDVELKNTVAAKSLQVQTSTGDVELERCDAPLINVKTSTGDVEGNLLSPKQFSVDTSTGEIEVPASEGDQVCRITTSTGDIEIDVVG